jgi:hypothetical protein
MLKQVYRYAPTTIAAAYARSVFGLAVTLGPLVALQPASWLGVVLVLGAALFLIYAAKSVARHSTRVVVDAAGIRTEGLFGVTIGWDALRAVEMNYYTTRSDGSGGWIELLVRGSGGLIRIESSLEGFTQIAARVAQEAIKRNRPLDDRARTHMRALGITLVEEESGDTDSFSGARHA